VTSDGVPVSFFLLRIIRYSVGVFVCDTGGGEGQQPVTIYKFIFPPTPKNLWRMNSYDDRVCAIKEAAVKLLNDRRVAGDTTVPLLLNDTNIAGFVWGVQRGDYVVMVVAKFNRATAINLLQFCQWGPLGPPGDGLPLPTQPYVPRCVVVYMEKITSQAQTDLAQCRHTVIEVFTEDDMINNPTVNHMVPDYELLTGTAAEEAVPLSERAGVAKMRYSDPARRYYGAAPGDVFRFCENRPPAPPAIKFRVVELPT
jgi:DNA-directed RNA polymerase subunit H (RpoH/RPB5)